MANGYYTIYKDRAGEFRWNYKDSQNGKIMADSGEGYVKKSDCENGINRMKDSKNDRVDDKT